MLTLTVKITGRTAKEVEEALFDVQQDVERGYTGARHSDEAATIEYELTGVDEAALVEIG